MSDQAWVSMWGPDPRPWLHSAVEPSARWLCLTALDGLPGTQPLVEATRREVVSDSAVQELVGRLPDWTTDAGASGHNAPAFAPNLLHLLAELGVRANDDERIERLLDQMLDRQDQAGRFETFGRVPGSEPAMWGALACDTHAVTEVMVRYGRTADPRVQRSLGYMAATVTATAQGPGWRCTPHTVTGWRGPGRKGDICPQVTLEALRTFARLPEDDRPPGLAEAARTSLAIWRRRNEEHPYMFGHGVDFKTVKWPPLWYGMWTVLDTIGRYPPLWSGPDAHSDDRRSVAELAACLMAYNVAADGTVTPRSCYRGFAGFSFGVKKQPSPIATAMVATVVRRFAAIADAVAAVDALALTSSRGASTPVGPKQ